MKKIIRVKLKPKLEPKQRVKLIYDDDGRIGTVITVGPEVSEVRWDDSRRIPHYYINKVLRVLGGSDLPAPKAIVPTLRRASLPREA